MMPLRRSDCPPRRGTTLVELLVALAILGVAATVVALSAPHPAQPTDEARARAELAALRSRAVASGRVQTAVIIVGARGRLATAMPDGTLITDSIGDVDRYTGRPADARR